MDCEDHDCATEESCFLVPDAEMSLSAANASFVGEAFYDYAGLSLAGAGDVNADGYDDFMIGAPFATAGGTSAGAAYLVLDPVSGEHGLYEADATLFSETPGAGAGHSVSGVSFPTR